MRDHHRKFQGKKNETRQQNDTTSSSPQETSRRTSYDFTYRPPGTGGIASPRLTNLRRVFSSDPPRAEYTDPSVRSSQQQKRLFREAFPHGELSPPQTTTREGMEFLFREQATPLSAHEKKFLQNPPIYPVTYYDQRTGQSTTIEYPISPQSGTPYTPYAFLGTGPSAQLHFTDNPQDPRYALQPTH